MKILVLGDRMIGGYSAYSKVCYETCTRLVEMGHEVAHIPMGRANWMADQPIDGVLVFKSGNDPAGEDVALESYCDFQADIIVTVKEPWIFKYIWKSAMNFVPMAVVDHSPVSAAIIDRLQIAFKTISISRHAQKELKSKGVESFYIPHGVRTDIFKPEDKAAAKKTWYTEPEDFVVGVVAMNRSRKMILRMCRGYKRFLELNPDVKSHLYLWTNIMPDRYPQETSLGVSDVGVALMPEIYELGLGKPPNDIRWFKPEDYNKIMAKGGLPDRNPKGGWDMVSLYNSFDAHLLCSGGEGFGLTLVEAQSCGVPVVTTDYAAGPEQVGAGYTVPANDYVVITTPGTRYALADIDKMAEALTKIYNADRTKLARRARRFAERYDWKVIMKDYWTPFLEECEDDLFPLITKGGQTRWS